MIDRTALLRLVVPAVLAIALASVFATRSAMAEPPATTAAALGQKAVMLLQTGAPEVQDKRAHAVLNKLDVQPAHTADLVAELV